MKKTIALALSLFLLIPSTSNAQNIDKLLRRNDPRITAKSNESCRLISTYGSYLRTIGRKKAIIKNHKQKRAWKMQLVNNRWRVTEIEYK